MKGRYNGGRMTVDETIRPGRARLDRSADLAERLTERARFRIKVLGQLTPAEYSARLKIKGLPTRDVIVLQT